MTDQGKTPQGWRRERVSDILQIRSGTVNPGRYPDEYFELHSIPAYDADRTAQTEPGSNIRSNKTLVEPGDSLFSKLNPRICRVWLVGSRGEHRQIATTEFLPLYSLHSAKRTPHVFPEYLELYLSWPGFRRAFVSQVEASTKSRQRLRPQQILEQTILCPPLAVQERIVDILRQAGAITRKRAQARLLGDQIISASFRKFFENVVVRSEPLGSLLVETPKYGTSIRANSLGDGIPVLRIPNVLSGELDTADIKYVPGLTDKEKSKLLVAPGDILLVRTNGNREYVGRCSVVPAVDESYVFASYLMRLRPNREAVLPEYLDAFLRTQAARVQMLRTIPTSAGNYNINAGNLSKVKIPVPDLDIQRRFVQLIEQHRVATSKAIHAEATQTTLYGVLLSRALTGELTAQWELANGDWIADQQAFYERLPRLSVLALLLQCLDRAAADPATSLATLMKYAFLGQMEGEIPFHLYPFVPDQLGPSAPELYDDLKALQGDGLVLIEGDADAGTARVRLTDSERAVSVLAAEAAKDARRAETLATVRSDAAGVINAYGNLDDKDLLAAVRIKYPSYS